MVTQSGANGSFISSLAAQHEIGLSHMVSTGNEADLDCADFIDHLIDQPEVRAIALFAEPMGEGGGIVDFSSGVEEQRGGGAIGVEFFNGGVGIADFGNFDGTRTAGALEVVGEHGVEFGAAGLAEHDEADFHVVLRGGAEDQGWR